MSLFTRNRPCSCGSGRTARDCCGRFRRLSDNEIARASLSRQARPAWELLAPFTPDGRAGLHRELSGLADRCPDVAAAIQAPGRGGWSRLVRAAARWPEGELDRFVTMAARTLDRPIVRVEVGRAVLALREDGVLDEYVTAVALVDLDEPVSVLMQAAAVTAIRDRLAGGPHQPAESGPAPAHEPAPA